MRIIYIDYKVMSHYRIYAKILGPVLPDKVMNYEDCYLAPMSISEQEKRKFKPIEANSPVPTSEDKDYYKTYVTHHRVSDPRIIKTEHVMYTDINTYDVGSALGHAINKFEKLTGSLAVTYSAYWANKHKRKSLYTNYEYQIVRIYELINGEESSAEVPVFAGGMVSHFRLPSETDMGVLDGALMERILKSRDDIFWKALGYLQSGGKGFHNNTPTEKMTLDFMKSIELIVKLWAGKSFLAKLKKSVKELEIDPEDHDLIKKLWKLRSDGDVAHAKRGSKKDYLPAQYPTPSNVDSPFIDSSSLAMRVLIKYFLFRDSIFSIRLSEEKHYSLNELIDVNQGSAFLIRPSNKDKKYLTPFLKKKISTHFDIPVKNIKTYSYQLPDIHFRISEHLKFSIHKNKIPKKMLILFGKI